MLIVLPIFRLDFEFFSFRAKKLVISFKSSVNIKRIEIIFCLTLNLKDKQIWLIMTTFNYFNYDNWVFLLIITFTFSINISSAIENKETIGNTTTTSEHRTTGKSGLTLDKSSSSSSPANHPYDHPYQPIFNSDHIRPILVQRYPYLSPDERLYQPYDYKAVNYPSWPSHPSPWPPKYPINKPEEEKEDLEKSFLRIMYPTILIFALGSFFVPLLIFYNYKNVYGFGSGRPCGCGAKQARTGRSGQSAHGTHFLDNLINVMVSIEKAFFEVEQKLRSSNQSNHLITK